MDVSVVLVSFNRLEDTICAIESLHGLPDRPDEIIVVDNGSRVDETTTYIGLGLPELIALRVEKNAGFARGCNDGIRRALAGDCKFILILNNDAILEPGCLTRLQESLRNPAFGAACPLVVNMNDTNIVYSAGGECYPASGAIANRLKGQPRDAAMRPATISFAPGCAVLVRRKAFEEVGLFPERWYLYFEDVEFSLKLIEHGMAITYVPEAVARHAEGSTMRGSQQNYFYYWRNRLLFLQEYGSGRAKVASMLSTLSTMSLMMVFNLLNREPRRAKLLLLAAIAGLRKDWNLGLAAANDPARL
jgi:GT2 family glycosyltransferase